MNQYHGRYVAFLIAAVTPRLIPEPRPLPHPASAWSVRLSRVPKPWERCVLIMPNSSFSRARPSATVHGHPPRAKGNQRHAEWPNCPIERILMSNLR
jgi:hypothetical protein